jgi:hypothetical protein
MTASLLIAFVSRRKLADARIDVVAGRARRAQREVGRCRFRRRGPSPRPAVEEFPPTARWSSITAAASSQSRAPARRAADRGQAHFIGVGIGGGPGLESLAAATGGYATTIDLADDVGWRAFDLIAALHTPRVTGLEARLVDASGALVPAAVYVKTPQLADGEELELVAKLAGGNAPIAVELTGTLGGAAGAARRARDHVTFRLPAAVVGAAAHPACSWRSVVVRRARRRRNQAERAVAAVRHGGPSADRSRFAAARRAIRRRSSLASTPAVAARRCSCSDDAMYDAGSRRAPVTRGRVRVPAESASSSRWSERRARRRTMRRPLQIFYNTGYYDPGMLDGDGFGMDRRFRSSNENRFEFSATRGDLGLGRSSGPMLVPAESKQAAARQRAQSVARLTARWPSRWWRQQAEKSDGKEPAGVRRRRLTGGLGSRGHGMSGSPGQRFASISGKLGKMPTGEPGAPASAIRHGSAVRPIRLDDLTAFVRPHAGRRQAMARNQVSAGGARMRSTTARALGRRVRRCRQVCIAGATTDRRGWQSPVRLRHANWISRRPPRSAAPR